MTDKDSLNLFGGHRKEKQKDYQDFSLNVSSYKISLVVPKYSLELHWLDKKPFFHQIAKIICTDF